MLLAMLTLLSLLAGCAKEPEVTPDPDPVPTPTPTPGPGDPVPAPTPTPDPDPDPVKPAEPKILKLVRSGEETGINPHETNDTNSTGLLDYVMAPLYRQFPAADGTSRAEFRPDFAAEVPVVDSTGYTWTVKLDKSAIWPDGQKITADDWIYTWKMLLDPVLMPALGGTFSSGSQITIKNAKEYYQSAAQQNGITWEDVGLKKVDDYTLQITLTKTHTVGEVMRHFSSRSSSLVRQDIYEKCLSADRTTSDYGSAMDKCMFAGPFVLKDWKKSSVIEFVRNDKYLHADLVKIDGIYSRVVTDESTRLELFEKGECDTISLGLNGLAKYGEDPRVFTYANNSINDLEVNINNPEKPWLADPDFRKALFWAIDRVSIAKLNNTNPAPYFISTVGELLSDGTLYRDYPGSKAVLEKNAPNNGYDPAKANEYLDIIMKRYNQSSFTLNLYYNEEQANRRAATEFIQANVEKIFDGKVKFELHATTKSVLNAMMKKNKTAPQTEWDLGWFAWSLTAERYLPWRKLEKYSNLATNGACLYNNQELNKLCALAGTDEYRLDEKKLADLTNQMEQTMYDDMTFIPVFQGQNYGMQSERIQPAMDHYVPGYGWGYMWGDIKQ